MDAAQVVASFEYWCLGASITDYGLADTRGNFNAACRGCAVNLVRYDTEVTASRVEGGKGGYADLEAVRSALPPPSPSRFLFACGQPFSCVLSFNPSSNSSHCVVLCWSHLSKSLSKSQSRISQWSPLFLPRRLRSPASASPSHRQRLSQQSHSRHLTALRSQSAARKSSTAHARPICCLR